MNKVSVIGLGYVGLPLCFSAVESNYCVIGVDSNLEKVRLINSGELSLSGIEKATLLEISNSKNFVATSDFEEVCGSAIIVICVPTPLGNNNEPDLSYVESAAKSIAKYVTKGTVIILESTVMPGTTKNFLLPILEKGSNLNRDSFHLVFSPERIDPMNKDWNIRNTPKIVSGYTKIAKNKGIEFYSKFVNEIIECDSLEIAETAKLLENSFRFINISFINEFSIMCKKLGIDVIKVIEAAASKPYGYMPFFPGIGVGGHCIPIDPLYLTYAAKSVNASSRFIELARQVNDEMPSYFVSRAEEFLGDLRGKRILILGVTYKSNVADTRESPALILIHMLRLKGAIVLWHDDLVDEWNKEKSCPLNNDFDLAILTNQHDSLDLKKISEVPILDTRSSI
jgi:UDP-N-acetyl-D-glucosamine dehydrogenase